MATTLAVSLSASTGAAPKRMLWVMALMAGPSLPPPQPASQTLAKVANRIAALESLMGLCMVFYNMKDCGWAMLG
jgi:hypothetical protein